MLATALDIYIPQYRKLTEYYVPSSNVIMAKCIILIKITCESKNIFQVRNVWQSN